MKKILTALFLLTLVLSACSKPGGETQAAASDTQTASGTPNTTGTTQADTAANTAAQTQTAARRTDKTTTHTAAEQNPNRPPDEVVGNGGNLAIKDNRLYYAIENSLYSAKLDGSGKKRLAVVGTVYSLNIVGNRIYFLDLDELIIYSVKTDGSDLKALTAKRVYSLNWMRAAGDRLYYSAYGPPTEQNSGEYNERESFSLYSIKLDGSGETEICRNVSRYPQLIEDWIYYIRADNGEIHAASLDGSENKKLCDDSADCFSVDGSRIYYTRRSDGKICAVNADGTGQEQVYDAKASRFAVDGNYLYYLTSLENEDFELGTLSRIKTDGTGRKQLCTDELLNFAAAHGRIYLQVMDWDKQARPKKYSIKTDGTDRRSEPADSMTGFGTEYNGWIYYFTDSEVNLYDLCRVKLNGGGKQKIG